jgi:hypothetical protein
VIAEVYFATLNVEKFLNENRIQLVVWILLVWPLKTLLPKN